MMNKNVLKLKLAIVMLICLACMDALAQSKTLTYIKSISGSKTLAGQEGKQYWETMHSVSNKYPAMWGEDFSFSPFGGTSTMDQWRQSLVAEAKTRWSQGAVINMMFHACPPTMGEPCTWDNVTGRLSDSDWNQLITNGTSLNNAWKARLDVIAGYIQDLKNNGVEILFRPFHEMNHPSVFWWANRPGVNGSAKLYQITHDYLVNTKGLTNIVWVWNLQDFSTLSSDVNNYDPGSSYYDIVTLDNYNSDGQGFSSTKYNTMVNKAGSKPIGIGECGVLPTSSQLSSQPRWTYFLGWAELTQQDNSNATISSLYNASNVVTLDEMPGWGNVSTGCSTTNFPATVQAESYCTMSGVQTETTTDTGGGQDVGYIDTNDWMSYHVNVPTTGSYTVQYRVASQSGGGSIRLEKLGGGTTYGTIAVPSTGGWQTWTTISHTVQLTAGVQDIAITAAAGGFNINWFSVASASGSGPNIAYNRPVTVSSTESASYPGSNAVDANGTTRWSSAYSDPQWIYVDLGATYNVNRVKITWETAMAKNYYLEGSADASTWTNIRTVTNNTSTVNDHTGLSASARYIRMYGTARATAYGYSIYELEVYGTAGGRMAENDIQSLSEASAIAYPNPAGDNVTVKLAPSWLGGKISLINMAGETITKDDIVSTEHTFDLTSKSTGLYLINVTHSNQRRLLRILKK